MNKKGNMYIKQMGNLFVFISSIAISRHTHSQWQEVQRIPNPPAPVDFLRQKQASLIK